MLNPDRFTGGETLRKPAGELRQYALENESMRTTLISSKNVNTLTNEFCRILGFHVGVYEIQLPDWRSPLVAWATATISGAPVVESSNLCSAGSFRLFGFSSLHFVKLRYSDTKTKRLNFEMNQ